MARKTILITLTLCILTAVQAQGVHFVQRDGTIEISAAVTDYTLSTDNEGWTRFDTKGWPMKNRRLGEPELPVATRIFTLPKDASYRLVISSQVSWSMILDSKIRPSDGPHIKDSEKRETEAKPEAYGSAPTFGSPVTVEDLGTIGEHRLIRITVISANYWPDRDSLQVFNEIKALLQFDYTPPFTPQRSGQERYVIVSRPEFSEIIRPLTEWKRQQGFDVVEIITETQNSYAVKSMLQTLYDNATPLEPALKYILIVGDVDRIGTFFGRHNLPNESGHYTDLYYGEFTGDYLPEAMVGRLSVSNELELKNVIDKIINYEKLQLTSSEYLQQALLVAGKEQREPAPITTNGQVNYVKGLMTEYGIDTSCYYNPESYNQRDQIVGDIIHGVGIVNYTAHCYYNAWAKPVFSMAQVDTLETLLPGIYINNCCSSNNFYVNCLGETLLRKPIGGAVGVIGATDLTLWEEDYYWSIGAKYPLSLTPDFDPELTGAFDAMALKNATLGEMVLTGNMAVTQSGSPYDATYWEAYCLLGDPSMRPWLGDIEDISFFLPDTLESGLTSFTVKGTPTARVTLTQNGNLMGTDTIAADSILTINLVSGLEPGALIVTSTGVNLRPRTDTVTIAANMNGIAKIDSIKITDTNVVVTLRNVGAATLDGHTIGLLQTTSDSLSGALADTVSSAFGPLETNSDTTLALPLTFDPRGETLLTAHLVLKDSTRHIYAKKQIVKPLESIEPRLKIQILDSTGTPCRKLKRNMTYTIAGEVNGGIDRINIRTGTRPSPVTDSLTTNDTNFEIHTTIPDSARYLYVSIERTIGRHQQLDNFWLNVDETGESFEGGDFAGYPWQHPTLRPWTIDTAMSHSGHFCAKSGQIANRQTSDLQIVVNVMSDDSISFCHKTSSQSGDELQFTIDGETQGSWSGVTNWKHDTYPISEGLHTIRWRYIKDESDADGDDCAWIDDIEWPLSAWEMPCVWFDSMPGSVAITAAKSDEWRIWPNPAGPTVTLSAPEPCQVELYNAVGQKVGETKIEKNSTSTQYFTHNLRYGIYIVVFKSHKNTVAKKLVIAR